MLHYQERNFFGVLRVSEYNRDDLQQHLMLLRNGKTTHGSQTLNPKFRDKPTSYFARSTGIGFVMQQRPPAQMKVGIIGLGAGALAAYGRSGDDYRFYEIDPNVIHVAQNANYFTYLANAKANVDIVLGDARLSMEKELNGAEGQGFHLLVLDAFSSDAIPVHLVTVEAFDLYTRHLAPDGILALHITNSNVDLGPLVFRLAAEFDMYAVKIVNQQFIRRFHSRSDWVILSRSAEFVGRFPRLLERRRAEMNLKPVGLFAYYPEAEIIASAPRWTDDYSDLLSVLKDKGTPSLGSPLNKAPSPE